MIKTWLAERRWLRCLRTARRLRDTLGPIERAQFDAQLRPAYGTRLVSYPEALYRMTDVDLERATAAVHPMEKSDES